MFVAVIVLLFFLLFLRCLFLSLIYKYFTLFFPVISLVLCLQCLFSYDFIIIIVIFCVWVCYERLFWSFLFLLLPIVVFRINAILISVLFLSDTNVCIHLYSFTYHYHYYYYSWTHHRHSHHHHLFSPIIFMPRHSM